MSVLVKRHGAKMLASLPQGYSWSVCVMRDRIIAVAPDHVPIILGVDPTSNEPVGGWARIDLNKYPNLQFKNFEAAS